MARALRWPGLPHMRLWRLDRIASLDLLDRCFTRREDFDLRAYAAQSFGVFQEEPVDVVLRVAPEAAEEAACWLFHPTQTVAREADDQRPGLFDRVFQPLLDRTGSTPARLAPALIGASFAAFLARIMLLYGAGQLAEHVFDAAMSVASAATLYRPYLRHAASPGTVNARRSSGTYMGLRLAALAGTHLQVLQVAVLPASSADMLCLLLAEALFVAGLDIAAASRRGRRAAVSRRAPVLPSERKPAPPIPDMSSKARKNEVRRQRPGSASCAGASKASGSTATCWPSTSSI